MTTIAETFPLASFEGLTFPVSKVSMRGALRHSIHEFPHAPGGELEKMGRRLYTVEFQAFFHDLTDDIAFAELYPDLYPTTLSKLQILFEKETTGSLVIPNAGRIRACCTQWDREFDFTKALSGETTTFIFTEDDESTRTLFAEETAMSADTVSARNYQLQSLMGTVIPDPPSVFQAINDVITQIQAIQGAADAFSGVLEGKLQALAGLCAEADRLIDLEDPSKHLVLDALKDLWAAANDLGEDLLQRQAVIATWTVPRTMSVGQIATSIYGDAERGTELLHLNPIEDAFAVPASTVIRYYSEAA